MTTPNEAETAGIEEKDQTFISHLLELRDRLLRIVVVFLLVFMVAFIYWKDLYGFLSSIVQLTVAEEKAGKILWQNLSPAGGFFTAIKISMSAAFFVALPFIFYQLWQFIAPGLYQHERRLAMPILFGGTALFYLGILFARFVVLPLFFNIADHFLPEKAENKYDIMLYLGFVIKFFFAFGIAFQVPILTIVLVWGGITTPESLAEKRRYVFVIAFIFGMLLTPPDVASQVLLALPMWLLFELGLIISKLYYYKPDEDEEEDTDGPQPPDTGGDGGGSASGAGATVNTTAATASAVSERETGTAPDKGSDAPPTDVASTEKLDSQEISAREEIEELYPDDYKLMTEAELDAELDRDDEEMAELDRLYDSDQAAETPDTDTEKAEKPETGGNNSAEQGSDNKAASKTAHRKSTRARKSRKRDNVRRSDKNRGEED